MSDRTLLEDAARAAGIEGRYFKSDNPIHTGIYRAGHDYYWNPLISDSEALRLAVKLRLEIEHNHPQDNDAWVAVTPPNGMAGVMEEVDGEIGRLAATRLAIVRAAASIGRLPGEG